MIKVIYFFHRKKNLPIEEFQTYWKMTHGPLVGQILGVQRYVQCHTLLSGYQRPMPPALDGVEEIGFHSPAALASAEKTPEWRAAWADVDRFVDTGRLKRIVTQEILIKKGDIHEGMVKNIEAVVRKPDMPLKDFHRYWEDFHGPLAAKIGLIKRYVQSHTLTSEYEKDAPPDYDGVAETWFDDTAAMRQSGTTAEYKATRADEVNFVSGPLPFIITREIRFL